MRLIPAGDLASADPVLAVRWCLDRSEAQRLKEFSAENIHILFVIAYEGTDLEDRQLVPIDQVMTFLNFRRPGKHAVFAKVVFVRNNDLGSYKEMKERLLERISYRQYRYTALKGDRSGLADDIWEFWTYGGALGNDAALNVVVSKEHFPKEPSKWFAHVVNAGFKYPPIDQCDFRKRMLLLPLKLLGVALWAVITTIIRLVIALFLVLVAARCINFEPIFHPWNFDIADVGRSTSPYDTWFARDSRGRPRESRAIYLLHPLLWVVLFVILTMFKIEYHLTYATLFTIIGKWILVGLRRVLQFTLRHWKVMVEVWLAILAIFVWAWMSVVSAKKKAATAASLEFQKMRQQMKERSFEELYELLACRPDLTPALASIPAERRTLHLRFLDLKAKVCRPFAAN